MVIKEIRLFQQKYIKKCKGKVDNIQWYHSGQAIAM